MSQNKVSISDTDNNDDDTGKTHSNRETTSDHLSNKEGEPVEKRGRGRPSLKPTACLTRLCKCHFLELIKK